MFFQRHFKWLSCVAAAGCLGVTLSQEPPPAQNPTRQSPQLPPMPRAPVAYFRGLLALSPADLDKLLAGESAARRAFLKEKIAEYTSLSPEDREARLRATELRWHLPPLMALAPAKRAERLTSVPDDLRKLVEERLEQWDQLAPEVQKEVLENEWTIPYFIRLESSTPAQRETLMKSLSPAHRQQLESSVGNWRALSPEKRQRMCDRFQQFFELPPREKEKTLSELSEAERKAMENTLRAFAHLPPGQRAVCINSFRRFAGMTPEQRTQFLRNAERWREMSPDDRDTWRRLVIHLPPMPPGYGEPPLPPPLQNQRRASPPPPPIPVAATNAGR